MHSPWTAWYSWRHFVWRVSANFVERSKDNGDSFSFAQARRRCYSFPSCEHWGMIHSHLLTPRFFPHPFLATLLLSRLALFSAFYSSHTHTSNKFFLLLIADEQVPSGKANHIHSLVDETQHPAIIIIIIVNILLWYHCVFERHHLHSFISRFFFINCGFIMLGFSSARSTFLIFSKINSPSL